MYESIGDHLYEKEKNYHLRNSWSHRHSSYHVRCGCSFWAQESFNLHSPTGAARAKQCAHIQYHE
jgi:hypothetical protein